MCMSPCVCAFVEGICTRMRVLTMYDARPRSQIHLGTRGSIVSVCVCISLFNDLKINEWVESIRTQARSMPCDYELSNGEGNDNAD